MALDSRISRTDGSVPVEQDIERGAVSRANEVERPALAHGIRDGEQLSLVRGGNGALTTRADGLATDGATGRAVHSLLLLEDVVHGLTLRLKGNRDSPTIRRGRLPYGSPLIKGFTMPVVDVRNIPTVVEFAPEHKVVEFTEEAVTAEVVVGPTVVEFSWGELVPGPGLRGGGVFEGTVHIDQDIPSLPNNSEPVDPEADYIMLWDASSNTHVKVLAALGGGGGGGGGVEFATREETDAGVILDKALNPDVGAYAYDRFRHAGQHAAGKGTTSVVLSPVAGVVTIDCALSNVFEITLNENVQFANPVNPLLGQTVNILIRQNLTGGYDATFGSAWTFTNRIMPNLSANPGAVDLLSCQWDSTANKMRATFLPNFGTGLTSGAVGAELTFTNVGGGNEVVKEQVDTDVRFRTLIGTGDIAVTTEGDNIVINYDAPPTSIPSFQTLPDVTIPESVITNEFLRWTGEQVVQAAVDIPDTVTQTYLTKDDETATLPNSRQVIAGNNISLDYTTEGQLVISSLGMEGEWLDNDGCAVSRNTDLATSSFTNISFTTEDRDDHGYWDPAAPDRFTIPVSGWYVISLHGYWDSTNTAKGLFLYLNGTAAANEIASDYSTASQTTGRNSVAVITYLQANDYVILRAWSSAAASLLGTTTPMRAAIHRLGVGPPGPIGPQGPAGPALDDGTFLRRLVDDTALGNYVIQNARPRLAFDETDQLVNHKRWEICASDGIFSLRALGDTDGAAAPDPNYLTNHRAESMTGWTTLTGNPGVVNNRCPPVLAGTGTNGFWGGTSASSSMRQRISFSSFPADINLPLIDTGTIEVVMSWWGGSWIQTNYDKPRIILRFLNAALAEIGTFDTGVRTVATGGSFGSYYWTHYDDLFTVPALTRHIDVDLIFTRTAGTNNDATITDVYFTGLRPDTQGGNSAYDVTREGRSPVNIDFKTTTVTHKGVPLSEEGHGHAQFGRTFGATWRTSDGSALDVADCAIVYVSVPIDCSINELVLLAEGGPSTCIVDVWKATFANYPPTVADTITGATTPTISSSNSARDEELNGWTRDISAGDILAFQVQSTTNFNMIQIQLRTL